MDMLLLEVHMYFSSIILLCNPRYDAWEIQFIKVHMYDVTYIKHIPQHMDMFLYM